jgi:hypothetical protein
MSDLRQGTGMTIVRRFRDGCLLCTWVYGYAAIIRAFALIRRIEGAQRRTISGKENSIL